MRTHVPPADGRPVRDREVRGALAYGVVGAVGVAGWLALLAIAQQATVLGEGPEPTELVASRRVALIAVGWVLVGAPASVAGVVALVRQASWGTPTRGPSPSVRVLLGGGAGLLVAWVLLAALDAAGAIVLGAVGLCALPPLGAALALVGPARRARRDPHRGPRR